MRLFNSRGTTAPWIGAPRPLLFTSKRDQALIDRVIAIKREQEADCVRPV